MGEVAAVRLTERAPSQSALLTAPPKGEPRVLRQIKNNLSEQGRKSGRLGAALRGFIGNTCACGQVKAAAARALKGRLGRVTEWASSVRLASPMGQPEFPQVAVTLFSVVVSCHLWSLVTKKVISRNPSKLTGCESSYTVESPSTCRLESDRIVRAYEMMLL